MGFCSAHSWTCPSAWKRPRPSRRCPGRPCWWCWSQPWRRRWWWPRAPPPPVLPFDFHSSWRCWEARQMLEKRRKTRTKQSGLDSFFLLLWQMHVRSSTLASSDDWVDADRVSSCWLSLGKHQLGFRMNWPAHWIQNKATHSLLKVQISIIEQR